MMVLHSDSSTQLLWTFHFCFSSERVVSNSFAGFILRLSASRGCNPSARISVVKKLLQVHLFTWPHSIFWFILWFKRSSVNSWHYKNNTIKKQFDTHTKPFLTIPFFLGKQCILLWWFTQQIPTMDKWISPMSAFLPLEKLTHELDHKLNKLCRLFALFSTQ